MEDHQEFEALAAGYALTALDPEEREVFLRHLRVCPQCARQVADLQAVAAALLLSVEVLPPPDHLRQRVLREVRDQAARARQPALAGRPVAAPAWFRRLTPRAVAAVAAVLALMVTVGTLAWSNAQAQQEALTAQNRLDRTYQAIAVMGQADRWWTVQPAAAAPQATGSLAHSSQQGASCLVVWNLPETSERYVLWGMRDGQPVRLAPMWPVDTGMWAIFPGNVDGLERLIVTQEGEQVPARPSGPTVAWVGLTR